ncbi:MAG: MBL fold metallo-hydrolase [bacterium]
MKNQKLFIFLAIALMAVLLVLGILSRQAPKDNFLVAFLNVGQGDAIFIRTPDQRRIIIDGGPDNKALSELGRHLPFFKQRIDLMILTHPDSDHLTGLVEILKRYPTNQILTTGVLHTTAGYLEWLKLIKEKNIETQIARAGQEMDFGGAKLAVLFPIQDLSQQKVAELNQSSIVIKLTYGQNCFLLTGDADAEVEKLLLALKIDLACEVLKVSHHGSDSATGEEFLTAVQPAYAIVSVGENRFGLPSRRIISRLRRAGAEVLQTNELGEIVFTSDGQALQVSH